MIRRIEDYAFISGLQTAALVHRGGSIDWCCLPRFDSDACFACLLGHQEHGRWLVAPEASGSATRRYRNGSLILETVWHTADGVCRVVDFMPPGDGSPQIVRIVEGLAGRVPVCSELVTRFGYGRITPSIGRVGDAHVARAGGASLCLRTPAACRGENGAIASSFEVAEGERVPFTLSWLGSRARPPAPVDVDAVLQATEKFWANWSSRCEYAGPYREDVLRSLIVLKGLTYQPTGGIVAAPTTSLPERPGGVRNWDYRYCWLRDAALTLRALIDTGYLEEALEWRSWLLRATASDRTNPQVMYGVAGEQRLPERHIDWLPGFEGAQPVRIGNAAAAQFQLDVYGEVIDVMYESRRHNLGGSSGAWELGRHVLGLLESRWRDADEGIWEVRGRPQHFTYSKAMAWVAFDRAIKLCEEFGRRGPVARWRGIRDTIHAEVCREAWNNELGSFTQSYGSTRLDASLLLLPAIGFLPPEDDRIRRTVDAARTQLLWNGFVLRYRPDERIDGLPPGEGAFLPASFWLVDALALQGRDDEATEVFERALRARNDIGLLAEEYDPVEHHLLGNFPQALSHIALINAALNLATHKNPDRPPPGSSQLRTP
jgi:GH15 family glucan-1,4-alpha-glucosidase